MRIMSLTALGGLAAFASASAIAQSENATPSELADKTLRVETPGGAIVNTVYLDAGGRLQIVEENFGERVHGSWFVRGDRLCVEWEPRGRECWPYQGILAQRGTEFTVESDRGQRLEVTLL